MINIMFIASMAWVIAGGPIILGQRVYYPNARKSKKFNLFMSICSLTAAVGLTVVGITSTDPRIGWAPWILAPLQYIVAAIAFHFYRFPEKMKP